MTTILLPAPIPAPKVLEAGRESMTVTDDFRGAATATSDVSTKMRAKGNPAGWQGSDADTASHAMTQMARDADVVTAALEEVTLGVDNYVTTMTDLESVRRDLVADIATFNTDLNRLETRIESAGEDADVEALESEAAGLRSRSTSLLGRVTTFEGRITTAEDKLIAVFASVDTVPEGVTAADDPSRVDVDALLSQLEGKKGSDPSRITDWWDSLTPEQQEALKVHSPDLIGNLNGIPAGDRDDANRGQLEQDVAYLEELERRGELTDDQAQQLKTARSTEKAIDLGKTEIDPSTGLPVDTNLLVYSPAAFDSDGAVAVAYGDPDTADNTAVIVPGLTNDGSSINSQGNDALALFRAASTDGSSNAVIAWMGYDAPSMTGSNPLELGSDFARVAKEGKAEDGGQLLSDFVAGLRATDDGERSHLTVVAHSYGSSTAAHAATDGLDADRLVLIGSPGAGGGSDHVSDLNMPEGTVFVGSAENDPVTWLGRDDGGNGGLGLGQDPAQDSFGARRFPVADGPDLTVKTLYDEGLMGTHTAYLDEGSTSLDNISRIVQGNDPDSTPGRTQDANDYLTDFAKDEGERIGRNLYEDYIHEPIVEPVTDAYNATVDGIQYGYETTRDAIQYGYETTRDAVDRGLETGRETIDDVVDVVKDPVGSFKKAFL